eukprot:m.251721 g.251721  ORF g.251721 m.251721 type:complete len:382 (+) comp26506_c3_seq27:183-1328(+)
MRTVSCRWEWARGQRMMADGGHAATPPSPNGHSGGEGKARGAEAGSAVASSGGGGGGGRGAVNSHHHPTNADSPPNPIAPTVPTVPRSPHPDYPSFPLDDLRGYPYNHMINLDYPGLQCIYRSKATAAPIFIVPNFLSEEETDICLAKCSGRLLLSRTTQGVIRTSSHVRVAREETPGLHRRLAEVTARTVENLESAKIIRYQEGHHFGKHCDITAANLIDGVATLDGRSVPAHVNREVTCFIYLNDVACGGETAFYSEAVHINEDGSEVIRQGKEVDGDFSEEVVRISPQRGMLVMFFPTAQPPSGELPVLTRPGNEMVWPFKAEQTAFLHADMWHTGCSAVDEKYLLAVWAWPPYVDVVHGRTYEAIKREDRATDGIIF